MRSYDQLPLQVDCLVLGGGITGAGVARDAAMRGMRVLLIDSHDFASGTSHLTSKLVHGGFRYLEQGHVHMVMEGIVERNRLLNELAPNLVSPIKLVLPFEGRRMHMWLATTMGILVYDAFGRYRCGLGQSGALLGTTLSQLYPLLKPHPFGVCFWDAQTNDARLVMSALRTAEQHGAVLANYTRIVHASRDTDGWELNLTDESGGEWRVHARAVVNATGPWSSLTNELIGVASQPLLWIKGTHLLVDLPRRFGRDAIIFRSVRDRRALWAIPWENRLLVGTTESSYTGDPREARPEADEIDDLFESFVHWFPGLDVERADIRHAFSGVRPIVEQASGSANKLSREHKIVADGDARLVTVSGGKLTTFRLMAEKAVDEVGSMLGQSPIGDGLRNRLRTARLWPNVGRAELGELVTKLGERFGDAPTDVIEHLARRYGRDAWSIQSAARWDRGHEERVCPELPYVLAECAYLARSEWVRHLTDLLKRRTSLYFLGDEPLWERLPQLASAIAAHVRWKPSDVERELSAAITELQRDLAHANGGRSDRLTYVIQSTGQSGVSA